MTHAICMHVILHFVIAVRGACVVCRGPRRRGAGCPTAVQHSQRVAYCPVQVAALNGEWKLVYTSNSELTALLALGKLPFVSVGDITQTIDGPSMSVINKARPCLGLRA